MTPKPVVLVVVPARPPIDKYVAFKRVQLDRRDDVRLQIAFCDVNEPTEELLAVWQSQCSPGLSPYLLDVGTKKYHQLGSSAAEVEKMLSETENARTYNKLVDLINDNNRTGSLKIGVRHSIAALIRETYHVMLNGDVSQEVVFDHGMDVVNAFFFPQNKREWSELSANPEYSKLKRLWDGFDVSEAEVLPFTLPLYFKQLFMSGRNEAEINTKISWWIDKALRVAKAQAAAKSKRYSCRHFNIDGNPAGLIHVEGHFEAGAAQYQWTGSGKLAVGIFRNEKGQVHIKTSFNHRGVSLKFLYDQLNKLEPGRWYYEGRFNGGKSEMIMNGSSQFTGVAPSGFSDDKLIFIACQLVKFTKKKKHQPRIITPVVLSDTSREERNTAL